MLTIIRYIYNETRAANNSHF